MVGFGGFSLDSLLRLPDIIEARECLVYVLLHILPPLDMEARVHFRYVSDNDPVINFTDFAPQSIGLMGLCRVLFIANRAHVVVVAVIDECFRLVAEAGLQIL